MAKTHGSWEESNIEFLYAIIELKVEAIVDDLIPATYNAELHGRRQPQSWEDFLNQAFVLLLAGKRQWNKEKYPEISEQIKAIVNSLVSTTYQQHLKVKNLYSDWARKWCFISSQRKEYDEESVQYTKAELEQIASNDEPIENLVDEDEHANLDYLSEFDLGDEPELCEFAKRLPEFIEVKNPSKY